MELEFLREIITNLEQIINDSDPISIIGAAAWIPAIVQLYWAVREKKEIKGRKISMQIVDSKVFSNVSIEKFGKHRCYHDGSSVVLLATNIFIPEKSFFVDRLFVELKLVNTEEKIIPEIIGNAIITKNNMATNHLQIPIEYDFNLHREIICERDNIRLFALFIEDYDICSIENIENIVFKLKGSEGVKTINLNECDICLYKNSNVILETNCYKSML